MKRTAFFCRCGCVVLAAAKSEESEGSLGEESVSAPEALPPVVLNCAERSSCCARRRETWSWSDLRAAGGQQVLAVGYGGGLLGT